MPSPSVVPRKAVLQSAKHCVMGSCTAQPWADWPWNSYYRASSNTCLCSGFGAWAENTVALLCVVHGPTIAPKVASSPSAQQPRLPEPIFSSHSFPGPLQPSSSSVGFLSPMLLNVTLNTIGKPSIYLLIYFKMAMVNHCVILVLKNNYIPKQKIVSMMLFYLLPDLFNVWFNRRSVDFHIWALHSSEMLQCIS